MMRRAIIAVLLTLPVAASGSLASAVEPARGSSALDSALREYRAATAETKRLEKAAGRAADEASRLAIEQQAAAAAISAAEAKISASAAELDERRKAAAEARERLAAKQRPIAALVAGLVNLERRPPLLALASRGSIDDMVRTRALIGSVLPVVRARSSELAKEYGEARRLENLAAATRQDLGRSRQELAQRQKRFAALERAALERSNRLGSAAVGSRDEAIVAGAGAEELSRQLEQQADAKALAGRLGQLPPAPERPFAALSEAGAAPLAYRLPVYSAVTDGFGSIGETGIRSRGVTLDSSRGAEVTMPSAGEIVFAGPYRRHDGVVIIDHGNGWMTMLLGVRADVPRGSRLDAGERLGTALGPVEVELSRKGTATSPAMTAMRSRSLSIQEKRR